MGYGPFSRAHLLLVALFLTYTHSCLAAEFIKLSASETRRSDYILVHGDLLFGDEHKFIDVAMSSTGALVVFHSPGGNLYAGIEIGKAIRLKGFSTFVPAGSLCASACALAWLAGRSRLMSESARVGFHAAYLKKDGQSNVSSSANAVVGAYLNQIGLSTSAVIYITSAPPEGMQWLNIQDAQRVGLDVKQLDVAVPIRESADTVTVKGLDSIIASVRSETLALVDATNRSNVDSLSYFERKYDDHVNYFGKSLSKAAVLNQKHIFFQKWPERQFSINAGTLKIECPSQSICNTRGIVGRKASGALLNLSDSGVYILTWTMKHGDWKLTSESWR